MCGCVADIRDEVKPAVETHKGDSIAFIEGNAVAAVVVADLALFEREEGRVVGR
jgi:hypothetical protein